MSRNQILPYNHLVAITKSDTVSFAVPTDAILVGGAGTMTVVLENGDVVTLTCVAGQEVRVRAVRVNSTNTAATGMVACYQI